jgi:ribose-phosphate pyrophosphokinase
MTGSVELFAFADTLDLAREVGARLGLAVSPIEVHRFPDGESLVRAESKDPGRAIVFRSLHHPNEKLIEVLFAADSLRRQGVTEVSLVAPYLGYMRQDRIFRPGEAISQRVVGQLLGRAFDHVLSVEAHLHRIRELSEVFACPAESISAATPIAQWLRTQPTTDLVIGPDAESEPWIRSIAHEADLEWIVATKIRDSDRDVRIDLPPLPSETRRVWIVDDIASSGATLEALVRILKSVGIGEVGAVIVHALLGQDMPSRLAQAGLDRLVSTDGISDPTNEISLAPILAQSIGKRLQTSEVS